MGIKYIKGKEKRKKEKGCNGWGGGRVGEREGKSEDGSVKSEGHKK